MLRVPARWACASSPAALVQLNDGPVALCCIAAVHPEAASWEFDCRVTISPQQAAGLTAQDFSSVETHSICFLHDAASGRRRFVEAPLGGTGAMDVLRIQTPLNTYVAKNILLEGPRVSLRGLLDRLFASMVGRYVVIGCDIETEMGRYRVKSVELQGGYRGLALVCGTARVKLNHKPVDARDKLTPLIGLEEQARELGAVFQAMKQRPGSWIGVCLHAPAGCGALALLRQCAAASHAVLVHWSPTGIWHRKEELLGARLVVLCIPSMDSIFTSAEDALTKLTARALLREIEQLTSARNGVGMAVVLVGITSSGASEAAGSLFTVKVSVDLPDVYTRAALLAHVRGGAGADYMNEAHTLVGFSSAAVLEVAEGPPRPFKPRMKALHWSEIGGLTDVKDRLRRALILPRLQPELFARFGVSPPRGILLYGPPGCAKTSLVKALCSEGYFSFIYLDSATLISAYVGESERQLREVFRKAARQTPCIVFFDEVEVLGGKRDTGSRDNDQTRLLSTLLTEMDGFASSSGVCFVGATNTPHLIDSALLRPGRFDYLVYVPLPPRDDRREILALSLAGTSADVDALADATDGFSGADLSSLSSEVLLELLEGQSESRKEDGSHSGVAPDLSCLHDAKALTDLLLGRIKTFHKTAYDVAALEAFHRDCASFASAR
ncbi:putative Transitional endoplasmic reticulum ATPase [Trypanosoma conorhini]|uniref:Putative Transitional endoplasmic reticulum ATPase n=1 Tax=Trypanosoma conorhini TaxID=83891 RepID=A0A422P8Y2_9TRYP|nr:putative Transitional endoplasmic reticulum ATPase [Trypanosoma conorhini]RNF14158.1 putative Transitional endoplasmic reticulum ATPase [Trypanosoma conorhini]